MPHGFEIGHRCRSSRHKHFSQGKVKTMVARGELGWVGMHQKVAKYLDDMSWAKVYARNGAGEVIIANMQLVRGQR